MNIIALPKYEYLGASSRLRILQYLPYLSNAFCCHVYPLINDEILKRRYLVGKYSFLRLSSFYFKRVRLLLGAASRNDIIWIEKEVFPWWPLWIEFFLLRGVSYVLDYDDAVFHNYDRHRLWIVRKLFGNRLDSLMSNATLVVCGNNYLAMRAKNAGATWVEVLPTVIDLERYPIPAANPLPHNENLPRIGWIGSPSTAQYLEILKQPLQILAQRIPFVFRVIGAEVFLPGVQTECIKWEEQNEVTLLSEFTVGVMPLEDSFWERGKCGYKLIQYMACGLPVVASPVGVNNSIVQDGVNGYLVESSEGWLMACENLLTHPELCKKMGTEGRKRVEQHYSLQSTGPLLTEWFGQIALRDN